MAWYHLDLFGSLDVFVANWRDSRTEPYKGMRFGTIAQLVLVAQLVLLSSIFVSYHAPKFTFSGVAWNLSLVLCYTWRLLSLLLLKTSLVGVLERNMWGVKACTIILRWDEHPFGRVSWPTAMYSPIILRPANWSGAVWQSSAFWPGACTACKTQSYLHSGKLTQLWNITIFHG